MKFLKALSIFVGTLFLTVGFVGLMRWTGDKIEIVSPLQVAAILVAPLLSSIFFTSSRFPKLEKAGSIISFFYLVFWGLIFLSIFLLAEGNNHIGTWYFWVLLFVSICATILFTKITFPNVHSRNSNSFTEYIRKAKEREAYENLSEVEKYKVEKQQSQIHSVANQTIQAPPKPAVATKRSTYDTQPVIDYYHSIDFNQILADEQKWRKEQKGLSDTEYELSRIDSMGGNEFEQWCADLLGKNGFSNIRLTKTSGDQGADIIAEKDGIRYAIQCKCYSSDLGNKPIQEVNTGKMVYRCQIGVVMTNRYFTKGAKEAAEATGILLCDRDALASLIEKSLKE